MAISSLFRGRSKKAPGLIDILSDDLEYMRIVYILNGESFQNWRQYQELGISEIAAMIGTLRRIQDERKQQADTASGKA